MFDSEIEAHLEEPPQHYGRTDPRLLGETLAKGAQISFARVSRNATYECNGEWFRYVSGGKPFSVKLTAIRPGAEVPIFTLYNTGDGLTFEFGDAKKHTALGRTVLSGAQDEASTMDHNV